jgi:hypothetical protein
VSEEEPQYRNAKEIPGLAPARLKTMGNSKDAAKTFFRKCIAKRSPN